MDMQEVGNNIHNMVPVVLNLGERKQHRNGLFALGHPSVLSASALCHYEPVAGHRVGLGKTTHIVALGCIETKQHKVWQAGQQFDRITEMILHLLQDESPLLTVTFDILSFA